MKTVAYISSQLLSCASCSGDVVICLDASLVATNQPFLSGSVISYLAVTDNCGRRKYNYALSYDENELVDPSYSLVTSDIEGVFCKGCLTDYIEASIRSRALRGLTVNRPALLSTDIGFLYFDNDLAADGHPIWWNGVAWVDSAGTVV